MATPAAARPEREARQLPTVPCFDPEEIELDGEYTANDIVYTLEHIAWNNHTVTVRLDQDVAQYLIRALRRHHAARPAR